LVKSDDGAALTVAVRRGRAAPPDAPLAFATFTFWRCPYDTETRNARMQQRWSQILFSQGFGTRRECEALLGAGLVTHQGAAVAADEAVSTDGLSFEVRGQCWPYRDKVLIVLNKPAGVECSQKPRHHPSVMSLLPPPLRLRNVQPVGRLDEDTTGLLLLTDDGALIHRLTSPKKHVPKVYEVGTTEPVTAAQVDALLRGVVLHDDPQPVRAVACEATAERALRLTLLEGKYHQVKRMVAAAGNTVAQLHRSRYGVLELPPDLAPGQWRWLDGPQAILGLPATDHNAGSAHQRSSP
jgi:16S rRNA pseudouridine516 synthase